MFLLLSNALGDSLAVDIAIRCVELNSRKSDQRSSTGDRNTVSVST